MKVLGALLASSILVLAIRAHEADHAGADNGHLPHVQTNRDQNLPSRFLVQSVDPKHAEKVFTNFTNYVKNANITDGITKVAKNFWNATTKPSGPEGRSKVAGAAAATTTAGKGMLKIFQDWFLDNIDEFLESLLTNAYYYAPTATESFLAILDLEVLDAEGRSSRDGRTTATSVANDFVSLVVSGVSSIKPSIATMNQCPRNFDTYRKCFYVNTLDYWAHMSTRMSAFAANLFGFERSKS